MPPPPQNLVGVWHHYKSRYYLLPHLVEFGAFYGSLGESFDLILVARVTANIVGPPPAYFESGGMSSHIESVWKLSAG